MASKIFLQFFLIIFIQYSGYAFLHQNNIDDSLFSNIANINKGKIVKKYVLYNNIIHKRPGNNLIFPDNDFFLPLDKIEINYFIQTATRLPIDADLSLSRQIYANLKLNKLLLDYEKSHKKLHNLNSTPLLKTPNKPAFIELSNKQSSLLRENKNLLAEYRNIHRTTQNDLLFVSKQAYKTQKSSDFILSLPTNTNNLDINNKNQITSLVISPKRIDQFKQPDYLGSKKEYFENQMGENPTRQVHNYNINSQPKTIVFFLSVMNYVKENKLETSIYFLCFAFFIILFSSKKK